MVRVCVWCGESMSDSEYLGHILAAHAPGSSEVGQGQASAGEGSARPVDRLKCKKCLKTFKHKRSVLRHVREVHAERKVACGKCGREFRNDRALRRHRLRVKFCDRKRVNCRRCRRAFTSLKDLYKHKRSHDKQRVKHVCGGCGRKCGSLSTLLFHKSRCKVLQVKSERAQASRQRLFKHQSASEEAGEGLPSSPAQTSDQWESKLAVDGNARIHLLHVQDHNDLQLTLIQNKDFVMQKLAQDVDDLKRIKWYMVAWVQVKQSVEGEGETSVRYLRSPVLSTLQKGSLESQIREGITGVLTSFDSATGEGSLVLFERVEKIELRVAKLALLRGSSYLPLPKWLTHSKKGLINIHNYNDNKCFLYSVLAGLDLPRMHPQRVSKYRHRLEEVDMTGISYPVKIKSIDKFEALNPRISVSVFGVEGIVIVPLRVTRAQRRERHINLLLMKENDADDDDYEDYESHYVLIKDLSQLLNHSIKRNKRQFWCDNCLNPFDTPNILTAHREKCVDQDAQRIVMPQDDECIMKFREYQKQMWHDYVIYADLESVLEPYHTTLPNPEHSSTTRRSRHVPCGYCYIVKGPDGYQEPVLEHGGDDLMLRFLQRLLDEVAKIERLRGPSYPLVMMEEDEASFAAATVCYLCDQNFEVTKRVKCRDHDHAVEGVARGEGEVGRGNYLGAACQVCNLNRKRSPFIPVFFHSLSSYDAHHIVSALGQLSDGDDMSCIPKTKEKYISFEWGKLRFLDSFNFLTSSLEKLVNDLSSDELTALDLFFPDPEKRALVGRKGVFPYSWLDSIERFEEKELPPIEAFVSDLTGEGISEQDYVHAQNVYKTFNMETMGDYHDLYLMCDVLQLCDVVESFRKVSFSTFKLDPVHFYSTPGLSWSAALLYTQQELELLQDLDMHLMWEAGIRGGVATINCRAASANNPYVPETYDENQERQYVLYVDANNLYGAALSRPLPVKGFKWLGEAEIRKLNVNAINVNDEVGYLFEVSLEYGEHLHDLHNDFCLAPERYQPSYDELSPLQKRMILMYGLKQIENVSKLIPNLKNKRNYVVYGTTLRMYVELGLKITEIHRVMSFEQKAWLAPYIQHNTEKRQKATSAFQKNYWKLANNCCFGKCIEQVRKRRSVSFTKKSEKFKKLVKSPLFHSFEIFDHGLVSVERRKARVVLNRPVYAGQVVLDVSKEIMYNFHYNCMKERYGDRIKVCGSDTDSLIYKVQTDDVYADIKDMAEYFDLSDYPKEHPLHSNVNKKVPGKFKDEMNGEPIKNFIGLRPKMYSFQRGDNDEKCVGKGIPRAALKQQLSYEDYKSCLENISTKYVQFCKIGTDQKHHLFTTASTRRGLSCFDNKRYILGDNVNTLAFGHYRIREENYEDEGVENLQELLLEMDVEEEL